MSHAAGTRTCPCSNNACRHSQSESHSVLGSACGPEQPLTCRRILIAWTGAPRAEASMRLPHSVGDLLIRCVRNERQARRPPQQAGALRSPNVRFHVWLRPLRAVCPTAECAVHGTGKRFAR